MAATRVLVLALSTTDTLNQWWIQSVSSSVYYVSQFGWAVFLRQLARQPLTFGLLYFWVWILIWSGLRGSGARRTEYQFVLIWLAAGMLGVLIGRRFYANYYIQILPALSLLAAVGMERLLQDGLRKSRVPVMVCLITLLPPFLWFQLRTFAHWYFFIDRNAHQRVKLWEMCLIDRNLAEISRLIRSATQPGDRMFVWGPSPEFYFLSGRRMATAFPFFDVMDRSQPPYGEEEERTLEALSRTPPPLIVDSFKTVKMPDREGWGALLAQHYRLLQDAHGVRLYLRKGL